MEGLLPIRVLVVAGLSVVVTALQLWRRFADRRLWRTKTNALLFVAISLLSGIVAGLISSIPPSALSFVSVGASYPFWAPRPDRVSRKPGDIKVSQEGRTLGALVDAIWKVGGYLTDRLDTRLSETKKADVEAIVKRLRSEYSSAVSSGGFDPAAPIRETTCAALKPVVDYLTDTNLKAIRQAELVAAEKKESLEALVALAYDWRVEGSLERLFEQGPTSDPTDTSTAKQLEEDSL